MGLFSNLSKKQKPVAPPGVVGNNSMRQQPRPSLIVGGPAYFTPEGYEAPRQPEQAFMPTDRMPDPIGEQFRRERPTLPPMPPAITGTDLGLPMNPGIPAPGGVEMGQPFQLPADNTPIGDIPPSFLDFYSQQGMDNVDIPTLPENDYFGDIGQMDFEREYGLKDFEPLLPPPPPTYTTPVQTPVQTPIATPESVRPDFNQDLNIPDFSNYTLPTLPPPPVATTPPVATSPIMSIGDFAPPIYDPNKPSPFAPPVTTPAPEGSMNPNLDTLQPVVEGNFFGDNTPTPAVTTPAPVERRAPLPFDLEPQIRDETAQVERPLQERAPIAPISEPRMPDPLTSVAAPVAPPQLQSDPLTVDQNLQQKAIDTQQALELAQSEGPVTRGQFQAAKNAATSANLQKAFAESGGKTFAQEQAEESRADQIAKSIAARPTPAPVSLAPPQLEQIEQLQQVIPQLSPEVIQEVIPQLPPEVIQQVLPQLPPEVIENLTMFTPQVSFPSPMMPRQTPNFNTRRMNPRFTR